jgi:hypothetical protein
MQAADGMTFGAASIRADAPVEEAARVIKARGQDRAAPVLLHACS